ncbi:hypothetical protein Vadar_015895 [Vaccinium darrowii]|uniref:Uncharacterized protein n=1 Tax=Vaccinium darrowii TaxID=229202 RepID=A0ACB7X1L2_9ERIC|nr:hypothetical protein Vadar_015895 [Vaccinium darrowii]
MFGGTQLWSFGLASGNNTSDFQRKHIIFFPSQNPDKGTHQGSITWVSNADKGDVQRDERDEVRERKICKSFAGDLNFYGKGGIHFYTQVKTVTQQWKDLPSGSGVSLAMPTSQKS